MKVKLTNIVTPGGWNLLDELAKDFGGQRSDYQSGEVLKDAGSHYLVKFANGTETYLNKCVTEIIKPKNTMREIQAIPSREATQEEEKELKILETLSPEYQNAMKRLDVLTAETEELGLYDL